MKSCINGATTMPYPIEDDIRAAAEAGFDGVELWSGKVERYLESHSLKDLSSLIKDHGLFVPAICPYGLVAFGDLEGAMRSIRRAAEIADALGCPTLLVCPDTPSETMEKEEALRRLGYAASKYAESIEDLGVGLAIEPLGMHPVVPGPLEALRIAEISGHPNVGIMMDTFHYYKSGISLDSIRSLPPKLVRIVHVNGCEELPREQLHDGHRLYPGEGVKELVSMVGAIKEAGYDGFLSVEVFREEYWKEPVGLISRKAKESLERILEMI